MFRFLTVFPKLSPAKACLVYIITILVSKQELKKSILTAHLHLGNNRHLHV